MTKCLIRYGAIIRIMALGPVTFTWAPQKLAEPCPLGNHILSHTQNVVYCLDLGVISYYWMINVIDLPTSWKALPLTLTHWGLVKVAAISQTTFSNSFYWMKMYGSRLRFHWILFLRVLLTIFEHWFRYGLLPIRRQTIIRTNAC